MTDAPTLYPTREAYIDALVNAAETFLTEGLEELGIRVSATRRRLVLKGLRHDAETGVNPDVWRTMLDGDATEQARVGYDFLDTMRRALVESADELRLRR